MDDILKIVKFLKVSGLLLKGASEAIQNEAKEQKLWFPSILLGTLAASLLGNMLQRKRINRAGDGIIRAGYRSKRSESKKF